jgi:hypothetical protein
MRFTRVSTRTIAAQHGAKKEATRDNTKSRVKERRRTKGDRHDTEALSRGQRRSGRKARNGGPMLRLERPLPASEHRSEG